MSIVMLKCNNISFPAKVLHTRARARACVHIHTYTYINTDMKNLSICKTGDIGFPNDYYIILCENRLDIKYIYIYIYIYILPRDL